MYAQRRPVYRPARRGPNWLMLGCGCLGAAALVIVVAVIGVLAFLPRFPDIAAGVVGMASRGETNALFAGNAPPPTVEIQNPTQPQQVTVNLGSYGGTQSLPPTSDYYNVVVGSDTTGRETAVVTFDETGLLNFCRERSPLCSGADPRFQNPRIDLRPGGAIIYADVTVPTQFGFNVTQNVGAVLELDASGRQFQFAGFDLGGTLYDAPPTEFSATIDQAEQTGNDLLNQLSINAGGGQLALSEVYIDDTTLTLIMR